MKKKEMILLGSLALGISSIATAEVSGNVSIGTDYIYRGISQTNENPTIQGGLDFEVESGFYLGTWASNVAFDGSVEIDVYAGFGGSINDDLGYDIGVLAYMYPDDGQDGNPDSNFNEIYGSLSFKGLTFGLAYSPDFFLESGDALYTYVDYELELPNEFGLSFHFADQSIDKALDYNDYSIGVSKSVAGLDLSVTWHDTDLSKSECGGDYCESRIVLAIGKSL